MNAKRMFALLPLVCIALAGCPQKRKVREKTAPATPGPTGTKPAGTKPAGTKPAGTKPTAPATGKVKKPAAPPPKGVQAIDLVQCTVAGNCILESSNCCPACLNTPAEKMQAMNKAQWKKFQQTCKAKKVQCKKCMDPGFNNNYVVLCESNKCVVRDFRKTAHARCSSNDDCVLRAAPCCDCKGPPVALSNDGLATYQTERCSAKKCKACAAAKFKGVTAICVKGRCAMKGQWKKKKMNDGVSTPKKKK